MDDLAQRFAAYLQHKMPGASAVEVMNVSRIHGGASRETFRLRARWRDGDRVLERPLVIRRDPVAGLLETQCATEYYAYLAFHRTGFPVPEPLFLEPDPKWLDRPFFVMEQIEDCVTPSLFNSNPYGANAEKIGRQFWTLLGRIAAEDPIQVGLAGKMEKVTAGECWKREVEYWEKVIDDDELTPQPIARAALRWLKRNPPLPAQKIAVVHGDYRSGNFLFNEQGEIKAILDWEMCHLGDPLEDIAWAADPLWAPEQSDRPGGMIARGEAFDLWERASGLRIDAMALRWWEIFSSVKGLAIWISAGKEYHTGANRDPVLAFASWYCTSRHNELLAERLSKLAAEART
jgi:aminoglycoside phosphotransferase (APT) family kinase protein